MTAAGWLCVAMTLVFSAACTTYRLPLRSRCLGTGRFFPAFSQEWRWGHPDRRRALTKPSDYSASTSNLPDSFVSFYQRHLTRPRSSRRGFCPFVPTCSVYARAAMQRYGELAGLFLSLDRLLIREPAGGHGAYPTVCVDGIEMHYDPVP